MNVHNLLLAGALLAPAIGYSQVSSGQSYRIASACNVNKVMAVAGSSVSDKALIVLQSLDLKKTSQIFKIESSGAGFKITAQNSGKVFNIVNASTASKAALEQYKFTGVPSESFKVSSTSDGYVRFQNVNSGLYVNLVNANTAENNPFEQYIDSTSCAEKFKLTAVAAPVPTPVPTPTPAPTPAPIPAPSPTPTPTPPPTTGTRDPLKQPFASNSIWNMPIGSGAIFQPANLSANPGNNIWAQMPGVDREHLLFTPTAPLVTINYSNVGWSGGNRCAATGGMLTQIPMPSTYVIPNGNGNTAVVSLMPDKRSLVQVQPVARCTAGGSATALVKFAPVDLYGDGRLGAHGGSGLSSIGGSIRLGELRPGSAEGPRHALKINVYAKEALFRCSVKSDCYRWPAVTGDSYAVGWYGTANNNSNSNMKMGSLLALPGSVNIGSLGLETAPAKQLAWTLQNYGGYIVDDTYAAGFDFSIEAGPNGGKDAEFQKDYGFPINNRVNSASTSAWVRDIQRIVKALHVVTNNGPTSIGGGGTPRQPLAPAIAP